MCTKLICCTLKKKEDINKWWVNYSRSSKVRLKQIDLQEYEPLPPLFVLATKPTPQASRSFVNAIGPSNILLVLSESKAILSWVNEHWSWDQDGVCTSTSLPMRWGDRRATLVDLFKDCGRNATTGAAKANRQILDNLILLFFFWSISSTYPVKWNK